MHESRLEITKWFKLRIIHPQFHLFYDKVTFED